MEDGYLRYPGASTVASQPLHRLPANPRNPAMNIHSRHPSHQWNNGRKKNKGWEGGGQPFFRQLHKRSTKNSKCNVQSYHVPREPALMGLTAGCTRSLWAAWWLSLWTAWPLHSWTAWPLSSWMDRLTAKLVVVNLVKLHLTKFNQLLCLSGRCVPGICRGFHCGQPAPR